MGYDNLDNARKNNNKIREPKCPACGCIMNCDYNTGLYYCPACNIDVVNAESRYDERKTQSSTPKTSGSGKLLSAICFILFVGGICVNYLDLPGRINNEQQEETYISETIVPETTNYVEDATEAQVESETIEAESSTAETFAESSAAIEYSGTRAFVDSRKPDYTKMDFSVTEERAYQYTSYDESQVRTLSYSEFPVSVANYYGTLQRYGLPEWQNYLDDELNKSYCDSLAKFFRENCASEFDAVTNAIAFVQSLDYISDGDTEYPKYPIETLCDKGGDCEDKAILLCGIIRSMGYGSVLIVLENHCAVGILSSNIDGSYYDLDGNKYYYVETTSPGWKIGRIPDEYQGASARLIRIQ